MALLAAADVRTWAGLDGGDDDWDDPAVENLVDRSASTLSQSTGVPFEESAQTVYLRGGGSEIWLPYPKATGATLTVSVREQAGDTWDALGASDFEEITDHLRWATRLHRVDGFWPAGVDTVRVVYSSAGWTSGTVPEDVRDALLDLVAYQLRNRFRRQGAGQNTPAEPLPQTVQRVLRTRSNYYRRRRRSTALLPT